MPGYSEACVQGHHESCGDRDCRCMCPSHPWNRKLATPPAPAPGTGLICPKCVKVPKTGDVFCRNDGAKLVIGKSCSCGMPCDEADLFCGKCGQKFGWGHTSSPDPQFTEEEIIALEAKARTRPSDVEVPPTEVH